MTCANEDATATVAGAGKAPKPPERAHSAKAKQFRSRRSPSRCRPGCRPQIKLKVSAKGGKALRKATKAGKKGKATLTATLTDDLGQSATDTTKVKFKPKKK